MIVKTTDIAIGIKFANNCLKNGNFSKLFPLSNQVHGMNVRNPLKYQINKAYAIKRKIRYNNQQNYRIMN